MVEAIRKGYWDASTQTRRELVERWQTLTAEHGANAGEPVTRAFIEQLAAGFGLAQTTQQDADSGAVEAGETVRGRVMQPIPARLPDEHELWRPLLGIVVLLLLALLGVVHQLRANRRITAHF